MARAPRPGMGIGTPLTVKNKRLYRQYLDAVAGDGAEVASSAVSAFFHEDAHVKMGHPVDETRGGAGYMSEFLAPLMRAFRGLKRQDYVMIGGEYLGAEWVTSTGYFFGHFVEPLFGIPPSGKLAFLRYGEFLRVKNGKCVEAECYLGLAELIIAEGLWPLGESQGYEGLVPGPATHDGTRVEAGDPATSRVTGDLVENMLLGLTSEDAAWRRYWDDRMVWYGPGGFGAYATVEAFEAFQVPFERSFEGWGDGQTEGLSGIGSSCKAADGNYAFLSGWPQITGVHVKTFLGIEPTGTRIYMRDCDWWRCENGKIIENWCMVDTLHLAFQLGQDVLAEVSK
jgi:predicted ester cyclase